MKTFPEINGLNLEQAKQALNLAYANFTAASPVAQPELLERMIAIRNRILRLKKTERFIKTGNWK